MEMDAVNCPECGDDFDKNEVHWVTNAEGGVMYRLPCEHMMVGTFKDGVETYGPEHVWAAPPEMEHHHRYFHDHHHSFIDDLDKMLEEKLHEG